MKTLSILMRTLICAIVCSAFYACQKDTEPVPTSISTPTDASARKGAGNTYVLVPGAWHPVSVYNQVAAKLEKQGDHAILVELPGQGIDHTPLHEVTLQTHIDAVKKAVASASGKVILVGHSYGGVLISQVGEDMSEKIEKLVYIAAFMPSNGNSLFTYAMQDPNSIIVQNLVVDGLNAYLPSQFYQSAFYNTSKQQDINAVSPLLRSQSALTLITPVSLTDTYRNIPKTYITTLQDHGITPSTQKMMYSQFPETKILKMDTDHSPFMSKPQELIKLLTLEGN